MLPLRGLEQMNLRNTRRGSRRNSSPRPTSKAPLPPTRTARSALEFPQEFDVLSRDALDGTSEGGEIRELKYAGDTTATLPKTPDFSRRSQFLVGTACSDRPSASRDRLSSSSRTSKFTVCCTQESNIQRLFNRLSAD
jgi:hypothetical protein